ncbi:hypothetical protein Tco_0154501 [Tanacetum coccineum]
MELHNGGCCWPATREAIVEEEDKGDDEGNEVTEGYAGHEGVGGFIDIYHNMSQGDWQVRQARWMDQQDNQRGRLDAGWNNKTKRPNVCMITPSASSNICQPATTLSHTSRLIHFLGSKPTIHLMAIDEVYFSFGRHLEELHVTWAHLEKNGQDYEPTPTLIKNFSIVTGDGVTDIT